MIFGEGEVGIRVIVRRAFFGLMSTLLLIGMFASAFNIQSTNTKSRTLMDLPYVPSVEAGLQGERINAYEEFADLGVPRYQGLEGFYWGDNESARLIVRVDAPEQQIKELEETIFDMGGNMSGTFSIGENVCALTVEVSPDRAFLFAEKLRTNELVEYVEPDSKVNASYTPNDPYWPDQWGPKKVEANVAWDKTIGSSDILVAIIDTGIDYTHLELAANYVPLGYDWVNNDTDPMDDYGHGTHCAGIVAAKLNNGVGIAGLAQVRIMAEKVLGSDGWGYDSWVAEGIIHATDNGAKIISMSLGGDEWSDLMHDAVKYASDHGVLVIAAAGNSATTSPHYPAAYEEVIAVSATDSNDNLAWFSTYGEWIDLSAPGVDIYSTYPGNAYTYMSGTSMACPHVTGVAALAWSVYPSCTANQIRWVLEHTADDLGYEGFDESYGYGRVNARKAVSLPEHDVCIIGCMYPHRVDPRQSCTFNVTVANYGRKNETNVSVRFFVNETLKDSTTINLLEAFSSKIVTFSWNTTIMGNYKIKFQAVAVPGESLIKNNIAYYELAVRFPTTLKVPNDYPAIKAALNNSGDGDTILVNEGYYDEGQINIISDNVTLVANGIAFLDGSRGHCTLNIVANFVTIEGFDIINCSAYGVSMKGYGNIIRNNYIVHNGESLRLYDSSGCTISQNYVHTDSGGVYIERSWNNTITQNRVVSNSFGGGIHLSSSFNNTVSLNTIIGVLGDALQIHNSQNNIITSNYLIGNRFGLTLTNSPYNVLRNNTMANNWCNFSPLNSFLTHYLSWTGASDVDASNTVDGKPIYYWVNISGSVVPSDAGCVVLVGCENIIVENLELKNNYYGIFLANSSNILIRRNNITNNWSNYDFLSVGIWSDSYSSDITITLNNITANVIGMFLWGNNNIVSLNNIADNFDEGVRIYSSNNSIVSQNNITGNQGPSLYISGSNCIVESNIIMSNLASGIRISGSNHTIISNNIIANGRPTENIYGTPHHGMTLEFALNCTISTNNIIGCDNYGIYTYKCSDNRIFHNNFINNNVEICNYNNYSANIWDNGYPSGGNYWSSYNGTDSDEDGIGDTPYIFDVNNTDHYPLMTPWAGNHPPQVCSLIITGRIGSVPITGFYDTTYPRPGTYFYVQDSTMRIDTRLMYSVFVDRWELDGTNVGSGDFITVLMDKDHNLTAIFSVVSPLNVSISPTTAKIKLGNSITFTSAPSGGKPPYEYQWYLNGREVWNATSPTWIFTPKKPGNYTVHLLAAYPFSSAYQSKIASVTVTIPGDIDGDFKVNLVDLVILALAYGSRPGEPKWNPNADIDGDNVVGLSDLVILALHYGQHYP